MDSFHYSDAIFSGTDRRRVTIRHESGRPLHGQAAHSNLDTIAELATRQRVIQPLNLVVVQAMGITA